MVSPKRLMRWAALGLIACPMLSHAAVLYSNLGPGDSFIANSGLVAGACCDPTGLQFTAAASGVVSSVDVAMGVINAPTPITVTFGLYSDSGSDRLGDLLETFTVVVNSPSLITGLSTGALSSLAALAAGSEYWLVVQDAQGENLAWGFNNTGATGGLLQSGTYWSPPPADLGAFRVNGSAIPEPTSAMLLGLGLAALIAARRRT